LLSRSDKASNVGPWLTSKVEILIKIDGSLLYLCLFSTLDKSKIIALDMIYEIKNSAPVPRWKKGRGWRLFLLLLLYNKCILVYFLIETSDSDFSFLFNLKFKHLINNLNSNLTRIIWHWPLRLYNLVVWLVFKIFFI
jgi:hypothetical protein